MGKSALPAVPLLIGFFYSPDPSVRVSSSSGIGQLVLGVEWRKPRIEGIGEAAAVAIPHLIHLLDDPVPEVRCAALGSLNCIAASVPCLLDLIFASISKLKELFKDLDSGCRAIVICVIANSKEHTQSILPQLIQSLHDPEYSVRLASVNAISKWDGLVEDIVPHLIPLLHDTEYQVRMHVSRLTIEMGELSKTAWPFVRNVLEAEIHSAPGRIYARAEAAIMLSKMGDEEIDLAIPHLIALLSEIPHTASWAAIALGNLGERGQISIPYLMPLLDHELSYVRDAADSALSKLWCQPLINATEISCSP
jgi:HEAT repeat protein